MSAIISGVSFGLIEELRSIAVVVFVIATIGVWAGVWLEGDSFLPSTHKIGWRLLVWSLGAETLLTIFIFAADAEIGNRQRTEIIGQQRTIEQLLTHRRLSAAQKDRIALAIGLFKPIKFVTVTVPEAEPWDFVMDIAATLKSNGWDWMPCPPDAPLGRVRPMDSRPISCTSILDHIEIDAPPEMEALARALGTAIKESSIIGMDDVRVVIGKEHPTMVIMVGSKR